jgi:hypothetical protein
MTVELLYLPDCPHYSAAAALVRDVLDHEGLSAEFSQTAISDHEEARRHGFPGSPTLRVNGQDIEDIRADHLPIGFACRTYMVDGKPQGVPPRTWLERAVRVAHNCEEDR